MAARRPPAVTVDVVALDAATAGLPAPLVTVDLEAFDANADDLVSRAGGTPIRVASKSVRSRDVLRRVLARPGFAGILGYSLAEALWLALGPDRVSDDRLAEILAPLTTDTSPFADEVPRVDAAGTFWVEPRVVVDIDTHGLGYERLRQPSYQGVRDDLTPEDLT